jgi:hypothetical protein
MLSLSGIIICFGIPTYFLRKNRPPKIIKTELGVDIKFGSMNKEILENQLSIGDK